MTRRKTAQVQHIWKYSKTTCTSSCLCFHFHRTFISETIFSSLKIRPPVGNFYCRSDHPFILQMFLCSKWMRFFQTEKFVLIGQLHLFVTLDLSVSHEQKASHWKGWKPFSESPWVVVSSPGPRLILLLSLDLFREFCQAAHWTIGCYYLRGQRDASSHHRQKGFYSVLAAFISLKALRTVSTWPTPREVQLWKDHSLLRIFKAKHSHCEIR